MFVCPFVVVLYSVGPFCLTELQCETALSQAPRPEPLIEEVEDSTESDVVDARYRLARNLLARGLYERACEEYLWVWNASGKSNALTGVRLSFMLVEMADLARNYRPAKDAFCAIMDELQRQMSNEALPDSKAWAEWTSMCKWFGEQFRIAEWYENNRDRSGRLYSALDPTEEPLVLEIISEVAGVLVGEGRYWDTVRLFGDPYAHAEAAVKHFEEERLREDLLDLSLEVKRTSNEVAGRFLIKRVVVVYTASMAVGRDAEAEKIGDLLVETLDTPQARIALVRAGADFAGGDDNNLRQWLAEAEAMGGDVDGLRPLLDRAKVK